MSLEWAGCMLVIVWWVVGEGMTYVYLHVVKLRRNSFQERNETASQPFSSETLPLSPPQSTSPQSSTSPLSPKLPSPSSTTTTTTTTIRRKIEVDKNNSVACGEFPPVVRVIHVLLPLAGTVCSFLVYAGRVIVYRDGVTTQHTSWTLVHYRMILSLGTNLLWVVCFLAPSPRRRSSFQRRGLRSLLIIVLTSIELHGRSRRRHSDDDASPVKEPATSFLTCSTVLLIVEMVLAGVYALFLLYYSEMRHHFWTPEQQQQQLQPELKQQSKSQQQQSQQCQRQRQRQLHSDSKVKITTTIEKSPAATDKNATNTDSQSSPSSQCPSKTSAFTKQPTLPSANWLRRWRILLPFLWPRHSIKLQGCLCVCLLTVIVTRILNVLVPLCFKRMIDSLATLVDQRQRPPLGVDTIAATSVWRPIAIYLGLRFLQGGGLGSFGLIGNVRALFWVPIEQHTSLELSQTLFRHVLNLSLEFHLNRKTGELMRIMDRGTSSVDGLLNILLFNSVPTVLDILIACGYFAWTFDVWFGAAILITVGVYLGLTVWLTRWRSAFRTRANESDNRVRSRVLDSLLNYETVKYYTAEDHEIRQYRDFIVAYNRADRVSQGSLNLLNTVQGTVILIGLGFGCVYCAHRVALGQLGVGDFVLFLAYATQLYAPLNWFGTYYRTLQQNFTDMETMFDLMDVSEDVRYHPPFPKLHLASPSDEGDGSPVNSCQILDYGIRHRTTRSKSADRRSADRTNASKSPTSAGLLRGGRMRATRSSDGVGAGHIIFDQVSFAYDNGFQALRDICFEVLPGQTVAIVGPSGSGKSTLVKLLFGFYQTQHGSIRIDGQDVRQISSRSLRRHIGVVPQDTVLFNDTLRYNIRYGRLDATDRQIEDAADRAEIHQTILKFPQGYDSIVGERGLRLSGGEKQRIAIARTLLKNPAIVLLDEATSALDTETERHIQTALFHMCSHRTNLVIAHRLSTIVHAHQILLMKEGRIVEQGTHTHLLHTPDSIYASMWNEQDLQQERNRSIRNKNTPNASR